MEKMTVLCERFWRCPFKGGNGDQIEIRKKKKIWSVVQQEGRIH